MIFGRKRDVPSFVSRAPDAQGGFVPLRVSHLRPSHVFWWHGHVQPRIDADESRADRHWNWLLYSAFAYAAGTVMGRRPTGYVVGMEHGEHLVPCGLLLLLGRIPALDGARKKSAFVWYLTTAPREALTSIPELELTDAEAPRMLGRITLDVAVTHSLRRRTRGRTALYADKGGGEKLLDWYQAQGMEVYPADRRLPRGPRRLFKPSDGRYCYYGVDAARAAFGALDNLR